jgi:hypothetical protein
MNLSYLAGFFDGEGCIYFGHHDSGTRVRISASQVDSRPLEELQRKFGGYILTRSPTRHPRARQVLHDWRLNRQDDCHYFLEAMEPRLLVKKAKAREALDFLELKRKSRASGARLVSLRP